MKIINLAKTIILLSAILQVIGCATVQKTNQTELFAENKTIGQLDIAISSAKGNEVNDYAPKGFSKAQTMLTESIELAQEGEKEKAVTVSGKGLEIIMKAQADADTAKKEMWEVTEYRAKAISVGAPDLFREDFEDTEVLFRKTNALIEVGEIQKAKENQPGLIEQYNKLESDSLEKGVIELAKQAFEQAKKEGANKYAPKSFERAQKELNVALAIIESDRTQTEKANEHAKKASIMAKNASQTSANVQIFDRRDYSNEDIVLWYWQQLEKINKPFEEPLDFQKANHIVIQDLQKKITSLKQSYKQFSMDSQVIEKKQQEYIEKLKESHKQEIVQLALKLDNLKKKFKMEVSEKQKIQNEKDRQEREMKQNFAFVQSLFNPDEAQVYRKGDDVLISAHGFYFPSGGNEIQSSNFGLLNKIMSSIKQFPSSRVEIYGHTDSVGPAGLNLKLSGKRAENVASFIAKVGQLGDLIGMGGHAFVFGVLAILWARLLGKRRHPLILAFLLTMLYALSDEFHQSFVPGRHADPLDLLWDGVGAAVALGLWSWFRRWPYGRKLASPRGSP